MAVRKRRKRRSREERGWAERTQQELPGVRRWHHADLRTTASRQVRGAPWFLCTLRRPEVMQGLCAAPGQRTGTLAASSSRLPTTSFRRKCCMQLNQNYLQDNGPLFALRQMLSVGTLCFMFFPCSAFPGCRWDQSNVSYYSQDWKFGGTSMPAWAWLVKQAGLALGGQEVGGWARLAAGPGRDSGPPCSPSKQPVIKKVLSP